MCWGIYLISKLNPTVPNIPPYRRRESGSKKRLAEIDPVVENPRIHLVGYLEDGQPTYAYKLKYDLGGAELYKFTSSRF